MAMSGETTHCLMLLADSIVNIGEPGLETVTTEMKMWLVIGNRV